MSDGTAAFVQKPRIALSILSAFAFYYCFNLILYHFIDPLMTTADHRIFFLLKSLLFFSVGPISSFFAITLARKWSPAGPDEPLIYAFGTGAIILAFAASEFKAPFLFNMLNAVANAALALFGVWLAIKFPIFRKL